MLAILLTVVGISGTFTMRQKNSQNQNIGQPVGVASAMSATRILASGKPYLLYGTAWKENETSRLVHEAIKSGFRFVDTACQPKHYNEPGVGEGIVEAMKELDLSRSDLFIQTKFTSLNGQDPNRLPYDKHAPLEEQVRQSIEASLKNLRTEYIDSLVLHSPMKNHQETMRVWKVLEEKVDDGLIRQLGVSNCYDLREFQMIYDDATIKPKVLQNRFYSESGFDVDLREYCANHDIRYQSFWTLTSGTTRQNLRKHEIEEMAKAKGLTPQTLMYAYMLELGHTPLSGTTNQEHMFADVSIMERIQAGETILDEEELNQMTELLGI